MFRRQYAFPIAIVAIAAIAGIIVLIANSGGDDEGAGTASACEKVAAPEPKNVEPRNAPRQRLDPDKTYEARVETNCGPFVILLDPGRAPRTGASFVSLARDGFYDGTGFHRIAPGFVIQGGDPAGDGSGGPGYKVRERPPKDIVYSRGVVAMAKGGAEPAGTSGSQFFVVTGEDTGLPPDYALLGQVKSGLDSVGKIESKSTADDGPPSEPIVITKVTVTER